MGRQARTATGAVALGRDSTGDTLLGGQGAAGTPCPHLLTLGLCRRLSRPSWGLCSPGTQCMQVLRTPGWEGPLTMSW